MQFDPENNIVKLCGRGMLLEGEGTSAEAAELFLQAWREAATATEKFIAAHYVARHQPTVADKLKWDEMALSQALKIDSREVRSMYPSLYLNIAKCYEDLDDFERARENYQLASSYVRFLPNDGYGNMIRSGINKGIERVHQAPENCTFTRQHNSPSESP